ncbi:MAG: mRNA surveillance protein pelota [Candidatus Micrarchaeaceae archaeon]
MRILGFNESTNTLSLSADNFDDLYMLARVISYGDEIEARSYRRFRPNESSEGEQKEVHVRILAEKIELDKDSLRLRITGKILSGKPEQYVALGSYHTLNIAQGERISITRKEWPAYIRDMLNEAVKESRKARLGVVVLDEEKATFAYVRGYGIEVTAELYSRLSKRMKQKDYELEKGRFFAAIANKISGMSVPTVIVAGPGFTKDGLRQYISINRIDTGKNLVWASASDAERSGIREVLRSEETGKLLEGEKLKLEFKYLDTLLRGLGLGASYTGASKVLEAISKYSAGLVLVNDSVINRQDVKEILDAAYKQRVPIKIFNAEDDAGIQLKSLGDIAAINKQLAAGLNA